MQYFDILIYKEHIGPSAVHTNVVSMPAEHETLDHRAKFYTPASKPPELSPRATNSRITSIYV